MVAWAEGVAAEVAAAGYRKLETVDMQPLLVSVGQQPDEVVFLHRNQAQ